MGHFILRLSRVSVIFCATAITAATAFDTQAELLIVAYMGDSQAALIDARTKETVVRFATGTNPHEVRVSPDGRYAYVAAGRLVTAIDLRQRRVKGNFDLGEYSAHDIRISRDGRVFWAACAQKRSILEVDTMNGKVLRTYDTGSDGSWFVEVSPDERKLYTPNLEGKSVSLIDRASGRAQVIPLTSSAYGIDITPDGRHIWVSGTDLTVIDTRTGQISAVVKASEPATGRFRISRDGKQVVVALGKKVAVFDAVSHKLIKEVSLVETPKVMTLSGDGRFAFLTNPAAGSFTVLDLVNGSRVSDHRTGARPDGIAWAP
jgi:DNA-binding beta-propeller fold protein YncE